MMTIRTETLHPLLPFVHRVHTTLEAPARRKRTMDMKLLCLAPEQAQVRVLAIDAQLLLPILVLHATSSTVQPDNAPPIL